MQFSQQNGESEEENKHIERGKGYSWYPPKSSYYYMQCLENKYRCKRCVDIILFHIGNLDLLHHKCLQVEGATPKHCLFSYWILRGGKCKKTFADKEAQSLSPLITLSLDFCSNEGQRHLALILWSSWR